MSYYDILGVPKNASNSELKKSYHALALQYHPDKSDSSDKSNFQILSRAYKVLSDDKNRAEYDSQFDRLKPSSGDISYSDFETDSEDEEFLAYLCRCSGKHYIERDISLLPVETPCSNCSLSITVRNKN
jgi:curved DNA-binding protein CbpA